MDSPLKRFIYPKTIRNPFFTPSSPPLSPPAPLTLVVLPQHGRVAMLAICGLIAPEFVRVPGEMFQGVSVLDAHNVMVSVKLRHESAT